MSENHHEFQTPPPERGNGYRDIKNRVTDDKVSNRPIKHRQKVWKRAVVGAEHAAGIGVGMLAAYYTNEFGKFVRSTLSAGKTILNAVPSSIKDLLSNDDNLTIKTLEGMLRGNPDGVGGEGIKQYLTNFLAYKKIDTIIDQLDANLKSKQTDAAQAMGNITPRVPGQGIYEYLHNQVASLAGNQVTDPNYTNNNQKIIKLRKDAYATLRDSSNNIANAVKEVKQNSAYTKEQVGRFNNAWSILSQQEGNIKTGIEKIQTQELVGAQKYMDKIKPSEPIGAVDIGMGLGALAVGAYVYNKVRRYLIRPTRAILYR